MELAFADGSDYLPAGRHPATADAIKKFFVDAFPDSTNRPILFERWEILLEAIERIIKVETQWIDGSYVTKKQEPVDIDLVSHLDGETLDALAPVEQTLLLGLVAGQISKALHSCDSFYLPVYPDEHPARGAYEAALAYWAPRDLQSIESALGSIDPAQSGQYFGVQLMRQSLEQRRDQLLAEVYGSLQLGLTRDERAGTRAPGPSCRWWRACSTRFKRASPPSGR